MAANNLAPNLWTTVPLFYGADARPRLDLEAEEFLERQEALMLSNAPQAQPNEKVDSTVANFRGQARTWWTKSLPYAEDAATVTTLKADWNVFKARFIKEYFPFSKTSDANINWVSFSQGAGESVYLYLQRVNNAAMQFATLVKTAGDEDTPLQAAADAPGFPAGAGLTAYDAVAAPARLNMWTAIHTQKIAFRQTYARKYTASVVAKVVLNGLRETRLRSVMLKCITDDDSIATTMEKIRTAESQLPTKSHQGKFSQISAEQQGDDHHPPQSASNLDKISSGRGGGRGRGRGGRTGRGSGKSAPRGPPRDPSKSCSFCHRTGHTENDCRTKKGAMADQRSLRDRDAREKDAGPTPGLSITTAPPADNIDGATEALNAMLTF
jgi:hypothetical protein